MKKLELIVWLLTSRCNLSCLHCYAARFPRHGELNESEALAVVESAARTGVKHISFSGGEVFLRQDTLKIMRRATELGIATSVVTNGSQLTERVVAELADCKVFTILSIDGAKRETHEMIRGDGTWEFVTSAAAKMCRSGIAFSTVMAVNKFNLNEVRGYLSLAKELGAIGGCLIPVMLTGRATTEMILSPEETILVLEDVQEAAERLNFWVSLWCLPFAELVVKSKRVFSSFCRTSNQEIDIDPQGNVLLCDVLDIAFFNVRQKEIHDAWTEQENNPLVKSLSSSQMLPQLCRDCPLKRKCKGGCFARSQLMTGDIHAPDPLCPRVAKVL